MLELEKIASAHVEMLFHELHDEKLLYHNLEYTIRLVGHTEGIAEFYKLSQKERFVTVVAAWFLHTGRLFSKTNEYAPVSAKIMQSFLTINKGEPEVIKKIAGCILATQMPTEPAHITEQILCDSNTYYLGTDEFDNCNEKIRQELRLRYSIEIADWQAYSIEFLKNHTYFTSYCRQKLNPGKLNNIKYLERRGN
jgi:predicted metal-dependent HD superfamily phosphohydrolase